MELFYNIVGCCNFTKAKSHEVCTVLLDKGLPYLLNQTPRLLFISLRNFVRLQFESSVY